jgi:hypothetical protein
MCELSRTSAIVSNDNVLLSRQGAAVPTACGSRVGTLVGARRALDAHTGQESPNFIAADLGEG